MNSLKHQDMMSLLMNQFSIQLSYLFDMERYLLIFW